ncbi:Hint domain-containing protein [Octadecabacter sp. 1_MG-2023]|uniref:Hint domain-containing protein n=1 Tax=unclassified Octadecabacter TaxID=196158 RepID=UPI001C097EDF|nr:MULTISPECIES: Hint domain-containing protein [unclassified Octadecabacter]MBU2991844.1 Hint domain-containing protein [Octadecabacter sp. B2R22]MDO6735818.1 Hint domain-containing protein [Octadecabacter sp. 1_MG-2023]
MRYQPELQALSPWVSAFGVTPETRISTPLGERAAADLAVGDLVTTRDYGPQPITDLREALAAPSERNHFPVRISQGALGFGLPHADLTVGPQHRVLFEHIRVPLMFGDDAVFVRAKSLAVSHDRVSVQNSPCPVSFIQISIAKQGIIFAQGVPVETIIHDGGCDLGYMTLRSWELMAAVA